MEIFYNKFTASNVKGAWLVPGLSVGEGLKGGGGRVLEEEGRGGVVCSQDALLLLLPGLHRVLGGKHSARQRELHDILGCLRISNFGLLAQDVWSFG